MNDATDKIEGDIAPGEPAFIRRLPKGVDYTPIKTVFIDLPTALPTLLWAAQAEASPLLRAFNDRTVRAIDRALRREEEGGTNREHVASVRHELVQLCLLELNSPWSPHQDRSISVTLVSPQSFADAGSPGPSAQHLRVAVKNTEQPRRGKNQAPTTTVVLEERIVPSRPAAWDASIPFIDSDECDRIIVELLRKHFPRLMSVRVSARWRSNYSPEGWRLITQHIVPQLYEYLRPFYPVRRHRRGGRTGPAQYSAQLRRDITDIVRFELPHLAGRLTVARVTAAIQRYIARQHPTANRNRRKRPKQ